MICFTCALEQGNPRNTGERKIAGESGNRQLFSVNPNSKAMRLISFYYVWFFQI